MGSGEIPVTILDQMQVLDQQIGAPLAFAQERLNFGQCLRGNLPALGGLARPVTPPQPLIARICVHEFYPCARRKTAGAGQIQALSCVAPWVSFPRGWRSSA